MNCSITNSVQIVPGVGEERAKDLSLLGVHTVADLLFNFPYRYEDRRILDLAEAAHEDKVTVQGVIHTEASLRFFGKKKSRLSFKILVDRYLVTAVLFNRHFAKKQFNIGKKVQITGKWDRHRQQITVTDYQFRLQEQGSEEEEESLLPIYSVTQGVSLPFLKKIIHSCIRQFLDEVEEILPDSLLQKYKLISRQQAISRLHQPASFDDVKQAKRRMVYEEFFLFQLKMHMLKMTRKQEQRGISMRYDASQVEEFTQSLPFQLTGAQERVIEEILADMSSHYAMNRLLQGDVGSGKTLVAATAIYAANTAGCQSAFMVPTEILAEQHYQTLSSIFKEEQIEVALLTGSTKQKARRDILAGLQMGLIHVLVGTHALIQDDVFFKELGLVITDEQHRFGVQQRRRLREKGDAPDVLFMTATPIPRTLAITAFGDMDVSKIDELPKDRKRIETYWAKTEMMERVINFIKKEISSGRQAYVICPLIEESEKLDFQNAMDIHAQLTELLSPFQVGLLHGRLPSTEKEQVMQEFLQNKLQLLVSTTVVEVGVNVPNATVMVIQDAERFGLSQLHQLRGRVGRGEHQSYCILLADPKTENGKERMRIMQDSNDGFLIAEKDLELRGPGNFFGTQQSGLPEFKVADMIHDYRALEAARGDVEQLLRSSTFWEEEIYAPLRSFLKEEGLLMKREKLD